MIPRAIILVPVLFLSTFATAATPVDQGTTASSESRPNIVFIFADDWGSGDLPCHGHPYVKTPNIDRLAKEGTDFTRFTVASGVCSPNRTAVMTGHFLARHNIDGHFAHVPGNAKRNMPDWLDTTAPMLPRFLKSAVASGDGVGPRQLFESEAAALILLLSGGLRAVFSP